MDVVVVLVVVAVLVLVHDAVMVVDVVVSGSQRHSDAGCGGHAGYQLDHRGVVAEHGPGNDGTDERGGCEDDLPSRRPEVAGALDPQRD